MNKMSVTASALLVMLAPTGLYADAMEDKLSSAEIIAESDPADWREFKQENLLYIYLDRGRVVVALSPSLAQTHVEQIRALSREKFFDGLSFYRVIDGFVAQGGDVRETKEIKDAAQSLVAAFDQPLGDEINFSPVKDRDGYAAQTGFVDSLPAGVDDAGANIWHLHCQGAIAMARGNERDTAGTEFYIALEPQRYLDRNLTVFGRVIEGMEHLQGLRRVQPSEEADADLGETILSIRIGADLELPEQTRYEVLRSDAPVFAEFLEARRNRPEEFFYHRSDHIDICAIPVPVRLVADKIVDEE